MYTGLSVCFTGPIGYAIGFISGPNEWRYFFWITGAMTCVWAIIMGIFTPDNPVKAKFVTERQKAITIDRIRADQTGVESKVFKKEQMIEAFMDPKTWLIFLFNIWVSIPNGGLTNVSTGIPGYRICRANRDQVRTSDHQWAWIHTSEVYSSYYANGYNPDSFELYL